MTYEHRVRSLERFTRPERDCCAKMLRLCGKQLTGFGIILDIDLRRSSEREKVEQDEPQN